MIILIFIVLFNKQDYRCNDQRKRCIYAFPSRIEKYDDQEYGVKEIDLLIHH